MTRVGIKGTSCSYLGLRFRLVLADERVLQPVHLVGLAVHKDHVGWLQGADEAARLSEIQRRVQILANTVQLDKKVV